MISSALAVALPGSVSLGFVFLALGLAATFLMYRLWGYPFDKTHRKSEAPRWAMWLHRGIGYAFVVCYVAIMIRMVPRMWTYQVELPPRTVAHLVLGLTIGFLLIIKISIMRFFRHFEEWTPYLGTAILLCTVLLLGLSVPFAMREHALAHGAPGGDPFGPESQARVVRLLPMAGMPTGVDLPSLATHDALAAGRDVVIEKCVTCHDLKTILDRPRTPEGWWTTADRMGDKPALFVTLTDRELEQATAYLIAITPDLSRAMKKKRAASEERSEAISGLPSEEPRADAGVAPPSDAGVTDGAVADAGVPVDAGAATAVTPRPAIDPARARAVFQAKCSQCHELGDIDAKPPKSASAVRVLVRRMIENGLEVSTRDRELILWWLDAHYVQGAQ